MNIGARIVCWSGGDIPAGCRHVKYLKSSGKQYVNMGFVLDDLCTFMLDIKMTIGSYEAINGQSWDKGSYSPRFCIGKGTRAGWYIGLGNTNYFSTLTADNFRHVFVVDAPNDTVTIDDGSAVTIGHTAFVTPTVRTNALLFARAFVDVANDARNLCTEELYEAKVTKNGSAIAHWIPIVHHSGTTDTPYLYDKATRTYLPFCNKGTGTFGWEEMDGTIVAPS